MDSFRDHLFSRPILGMFKPGKEAHDKNSDGEKGGIILFFFAVEGWWMFDGSRDIAG